MKAFWLNVFATLIGVILSAIASFYLWHLQIWYTAKADRPWIKESLLSELTVNLINLENIQKVISKTQSRNVLLAQFFPYYQATNIYEAALSSGHIRLFPPRLQGRLHAAATNAHRFNTLLANVESFAINNVPSPSFTKGLRLRVVAMSNQAHAFAEKLRDMIAEFSKQ